MEFWWTRDFWIFTGIVLAGWVGVMWVIFGANQLDRRLKIEKRRAKQRRNRIRRGR